MSTERTRLKLIESKDGKLEGFVSRHPNKGWLFGVRENSRYGKMICLPSDHLKGTLKPNVLYEVKLIPMRSGTGYVIVNAKQVFFTAEIKVTVVPKETYRINISFGNKNIIFDPINGRTASSNTIDGVIGILEQREEISNKKEILHTFVIEAGRLLDRVMKEGLRNRHYKGY